MLRSLKEVQADDSVIGFYQGMTLGSFFNQTLVDTQAIHQDRLRHGGVVIVHGAYNSVPRTCLCMFQRASCHNRHLADRTRERVFPGVPAHEGVPRRLQEE